MVPGRRTDDIDPVGEIDGLGDVVGHEQNCAGGLLPDPQQKVLHLVAGLRVESAEGLVHQDDLRADGQRAGDGHALLHAAGERVADRRSQSPLSPTASIRWLDHVCAARLAGRP